MKQTEKIMTYAEMEKLALKHYNRGGDGFYECWDENDFNEYVNEFGPFTMKSALDLFRLYDQERRDIQGTAW